MDESVVSLAPEARAVIEEEETLLARVQASLDKARRRATGHDSSAERSVEALRSLRDQAILLTLRARREPLGGRAIALLALDEAEDFSLFELFVLGRLLHESSSVTVAGDEAQQTASSFVDWETSLATLGANDAATCRLHTSYRCPQSVADFARRLLGPLAPEEPVRASREGAPIGFFRLPSESQAHLFLSGALRDLVEREPRASVAVIAASPDAARRFHALIAELPEARLVLDGEFTFDPGIDVTDVDNVKGLEFDYVIIPDATAAAYPATNEARRRLHVAVTRASHQLWIVAGGPATVQFR